MRNAPPAPHRWTRKRYEACIAAGIFRPNDRVQLIEGELIEMAPQRSPHYAAIAAAEERLRRIFPSGVALRIQAPLALGDDSEPEPDIAVVQGHWRDFIDKHPFTALFVVEVADSTLEFDRKRKGPLYARYGIPEYWIVNLVDRQVEVFRDPDGSEFRSAQTYRAGDTIPPSTSCPIAVQAADLIP